MLGMLGGGGFFEEGACCQMKVRVIYVPNLPIDMWGKQFANERELMLATNIRPSDYHSEIVCK